MGIISKYFEYLYNYNKDTHIMVMEQIDMHLGEVMQSMDEYSNAFSPILLTVFGIDNSRRALQPEKA